MTCLFGKRIKCGGAETEREKLVDECFLDIRCERGLLDPIVLVLCCGQKLEFRLFGREQSLFHPCLADEMGVDGCHEAEARSEGVEEAERLIYMMSGRCWKTLT